MSYIKRAAASNYPKSIQRNASFAYEADSGINVAFGSPVLSWADASGNGHTLTVPPQAVPNLPIPTPPILRKDGDGLPYVQFDGISQILGIQGLPAYVGTELTAYIVMRPFYNQPAVGRRIGMCLNKSGAIPGVAAGTMRIGGSVAQGYTVGVRENVTLAAGENTPGEPFNSWCATWGVYAMRCAVLSVDIAFFNFFHDNKNGGAQWGVPGTPLPPLAYTNLGVGGNSISSGVDTPAEFIRGDIRAVSVYQLAHTDEEVKNQMRYYAHKWKVPGVLD